MMQNIVKRDIPLSEEIVKLLETELPSFFTRDIVVEKSNGLFSKNTLANLEQTRTGPPVHYMGRKVFYIKKEFIEWVRNYFGGMDVEYHGFGRRVRIRKDVATEEGKGSRGN